MKVTKRTKTDDRSIKLVKRRSKPADTKPDDEKKTDDPFMMFAKAILQVVQGKDDD